jgi:hypothetical protein
VVEALETETANCDRKVNIAYFGFHCKEKMMDRHEDCTNGHVFMSLDLVLWLGGKSFKEVRQVGRARTVKRRGTTLYALKINPRLEKRLVEEMTN